MEAWWETLTVSLSSVASGLPALARAVEGFRHRFGVDPEGVARAPGRVNLIGEHTDYNDGFVFPLAIDRDAAIAFRARSDGGVRVVAADLDAEGEFSRSAPGQPGRSWLDHIKGVAAAVGPTSGAASGFDGVLASDVPIGSGLSSSAAVEVAVTRVLAAVDRRSWEPVRAARAAQKAENEWLGVSCGIMDPLVSAAGVRGHALLIDCRADAWQAVPVPSEVCVVVLDSGTRRQLVGSEYNERRERCEEAARTLGVSALRDADEAALEAAQPHLDPIAFRRARHVVTENRRTLRAAEALGISDCAAVGRLMDESHRSLRDDFEVSTPALDAMVEIARGAPGCFGARLTGAGFGGCAVALVQRASREPFVTQVAAAYERRVGRRGVLYLCEATAGASLL